MALSLEKNGYWTNYSNASNVDILPMSVIQKLRQQSIRLRDQGRFEQSWSERTENGKTIKFDKEGVFACEPDGADYESAPDMLLYMSTLISALPPLLNQVYPSESNLPLDLSNQAFNAKLAVTSPGGSTYPLHIDNTLGVSNSPNDDTRKLTCILYLNPEYQERDGGELRLLLLDHQCLDLTPRGGRMVVFWSDEIPHEVLPCKPDSTSSDFDRYALTIWIPDVNPLNIQSPNSKFEPLRSDAFTGETWC